MAIVTKPVPTDPMSSEPARIVGIVTAIVAAVIGTLVAFGVDLSDEQQKAILTLVAAVAPVIAAFVIREKVYSPKTAQEEINKAAASGVAPDMAPPPPTKTIPVSKWGVYNRDNGTGGDTAA